MTGTTDQAEEFLRYAEAAVARARLWYDRAQTLEQEQQALHAQLRALVAADEVGDWKHAIQGLLPEGES